MNATKFTAAVALMALIGGGTAAIARDINVRGIICNSAGEPLPGVTIYDGNSDKLLTTTNEEGKYLVVIDSDGKLVFSFLGMEDMEVPVEGQLAIDATLVRSAITLDEVTVRGKSRLKVVAPEPTDIEMKGNYAHIKTRVKVPGKLFNTSTRLIIQPALYNVTESQMWYLKPVVYDGKRYAITQERMYDFDKTADPLNSYVTVTSVSSGGDHIITWSDSVYLKNPDNDFHCDMLMAMEDYNKVFYRDTTTIARGVVNPLRFFQYELLGAEVADSAYFPTPEMQMRDTKGDIMLTFGVSSTKLDMNQGNNRNEMNALISQLREFEDNPDAAIKSFSIYGTASPEGRYDFNTKLAKGRMQSALELIKENLSPTTRRYIEMNSDAKVESWSTLVHMLRKDGLNEQADAIDNILTSYPNQIDAQNVRIKKLPFYDSVILTNYLPRLRRVSYEYVTSQFRYLTDDEIYELYKSKPSTLSRYEFFRLYRNVAKNDAEKEEYLKKALETHPKFLVAANDLAVMKLQRNEPDVTLLEPFVKPGAKKIPDEARLTQIATCLASHAYSKADSISCDLPDTPAYHKAKVYTDVFNGRFQDVMQEVAAESPINEVVLLLAIKANDKAWEKADKLGNSAEEEYLKAIAANRVDQYMAASSHLENAIRLDPKLRDVAKVDGDLIDLIEDLEQSKQEEE